MQIKKNGMQIEFCCNKMKTGVLGRMIDIRLANGSQGSQGRNQVCIGQAMLPLAGDYRFIEYCPYCGMEIVFKTFK